MILDYKIVHVNGNLLCDFDADDNYCGFEGEVTYEVFIVNDSGVDARTNCPECGTECTDESVARLWKEYAE